MSTTHLPTIATTAGVVIAEQRRINLAEASGNRPAILPEYLAVDVRAGRITLRRAYQIAGIR